MPSNPYSWLLSYDRTQAIAERIAAPEGYERLDVPRNSFEDWLRHLPLKPGNPPVYLYNGDEKVNQTAHVAVIQIDVGKEDLQQCADAVMRLRAEYLYAAQQFDAIRFNFTSGDSALFTKWGKGYRPKITGNRVSWQKTRQPDASYASFRAYLDTVFRYAGTSSLSQELETVSSLQAMRIGDVFIQGGFPGHAVIVVDMARHPATGKIVFLLAQSYMPAQEIHILHNPENAELDPWYELEFGEQLLTPEWTFAKTQLKRFILHRGE